MKPRRWGSTVFSVVCVLTAAATTASAAERKPNILLILADDLGYADLGVQGCRDVLTPNIDSIARGGVRCASGYVTAPVCSPTRAALMTGRYQQRFGHEFNPGVPSARGVRVGLDLEETTMAERLRAAGYVTGMVGKWHLGHARPFYPVNRGFDGFYGFLGGAHAYEPGALQGQLAELPRTAILRDARATELTEYLTDAFAREAVSFIGRHKAEPFFLYLPFNAVHTPMQAPTHVLKRFGVIRDPRRRAYAAMLSVMDDAVGKVLDKLRKEGLEQDTLVFFLSDNGGSPVNASDNFPLRAHKGSTWEGGVRVPFFVQWKGKLPAGKVYGQPVAQIDILPTALAAAGVAVDPAWRLDGVDLLPFLQGRSGGPPHEALYWRYGAQRAIRSGDWKLVRAAVRGSGVSDWRLFNLSKDPREQTDLASQEPDRVKQLQAAWESWDEQLAPPAWTPKPKRNRRGRP